MTGTEYVPSYDPSCEECAKVTGGCGQHGVSVLIQRNAVIGDVPRGWECPKCHRVWNPAVPSCAPCATPGVLWSDDGTCGVGGGSVP